MLKNMDTLVPDNSGLSTHVSSLLITVLVTSISSFTTVACGVTFGFVYILKKLNIWNPALYCILNIAIADVFYISASTMQGVFHPSNVTSDSDYLFCVTTGVFKKMALASSTYFVVIYAIARLLPLVLASVHVNTSLKQSTFYVAVVWFIAACVTLLQIGLSQTNELYPIEQCRLRIANHTTDYIKSQASSLADLLLYFFVPFVLMVGIYSKVVQIYWARYRMVEGDERKERKITFVKNVLLATMRVSAMLFIWLPYHGSYYLVRNETINEEDPFISFDRAARGLAYFGLAFNRILYGFNCLDLDEFLQKFLIKPRKRTLANNPNSSQNSTAERAVTSQGSALTVDQTNQSNVSVTVDDEAPLVTNEQTEDRENIV